MSDVSIFICPVCEAVIEGERPCPNGPHEVAEADDYLAPRPQPCLTRRNGVICDGTLIPDPIKERRWECTEGHTMWGTARVMRSEPWPADQVRRTKDPLILLGKKAGGCTESCSEMHTFSWPCEQAFILVSDLSWWQRLRLRLAHYFGRPGGRT